MNNTERLLFADKAHQLITKYPLNIKYHSIVVRKQNVAKHIQNDSNKLYNYMIKFSLLADMAKHDKVTFLPDPRTLKIKSGNSLHDYLQTELWFTHKTVTELTTTPLESSSSLNIQFADMLSGLVQNHFEDNNSLPYNKLQKVISCKNLFFKTTE